MRKFLELNEVKIEREDDRLEIEDELRSRGVREIGGFPIGGLRYREILVAWYRLMRNERKIQRIPGWRFPGDDRDAILEYCRLYPEATCREIGSVFDLTVPQARGYKRQITIERAENPLPQYSEPEVYDAACLEF